MTSAAPTFAVSLIPQHVLSSLGTTRSCAYAPQLPDCQVVRTRCDALEGCGRGSDEAGSQVASPRGSARAAAAGGATPKRRSPRAVRQPATAAAAGAAPRAGAAGGEIDSIADAHAAARPATPPAGGDQTGTAPPAAATPAAASARSIRRAACPKPGRSSTRPAKKTVQRRGLRRPADLRAPLRSRFELKPYWGFTLNDQFVSHPGPGLALNYYITNVLAIGVNGNCYAGLNADSDFNFQNRRAARVAVPLNEYQSRGDAELHVRPDVRKVRRVRRLHLPLRRATSSAASARISHAPDRGHRPGQPQVRLRTPNVDFNVGHRPPHLLQPLVRRRPRGARLHLHREAREPPIASRRRTRTRAAANPSTWFDQNSHFTNNVQAQVGLSIFLPFSWEYRLPK